MKRPERQAMKRREAEDRNKRWASMTGEEKLAHLNTMNLAAKKQRARIAKGTKHNVSE